MVMNTAFGGIDQLPFDAQGRGIVPYNLSVGDSDKVATRTAVTKQLDDAIRAALSLMVGADTHGGTAPLWCGKWDMAETYSGRGAHLHVRDVGERGFFFKLFVISGTHTADLAGFARFAGPDFAYAWVDAEGIDEPCELAFQRHRETRQMTVQEGEGCRHYHGAGALFDCILKHEYEPPYEHGMLDGWSCLDLMDTGVRQLA